MRRVDGSIGRFLCALLTVVRRVTDPVRPLSAEPRRILVIKLAEQGATVVAHPALADAAALVGADNVFVMVFAENRFILDELEVVPQTNVITIRTDGVAHLARDLWAAVVTARRVGVDTAIDFDSFSRVSAVLAYLSGARRRSGLHSFHGEGPNRGDLMTHRVAANPHLHASDGFRCLVEAARRDPGTLPTLDLTGVAAAPTAVPALRPEPHETESVNALLHRRFGHDPNGRLVILNANAGDLVPLRRWPDDRYVSLARHLLRTHPDLHIVLTGAAAEARRAQELERRIASERCRSVAGDTSLRELLVLDTLADVLVTNDSGPAHFADLTPIEVVVLFGPETPVAFGSRSPRSHHITAEVTCSPCLNVFNGRQSDCTDNICMQRITVERVAAVVDGLLGRP